jgi:simple sugar transport system permease protein
MTASPDDTQSTLVAPKRSANMPDWAEGLFGQILAIGISLIGGAIIIIAVGENPIHVFATLLRGAFGNSERIAGSLLQATPIII